MAEAAQVHNLASPHGLVAECWMLAFESQQAIWLRTLKLWTGGAAAEAEAQLMMTEKVKAAQSAIISLMSGSMPVGIVSDYRAAVRANVTRLAKA